MKRKKQILLMASLLLGVSQISNSQSTTSPVDFGSLNKNGSPIRIISIGSSLSAGVRDGGINQASQLSSFPNIIAQQMGIANFKQPLFGVNGTGSEKVTQNSNGVLQFTKNSPSATDDDSKQGAKLSKVTTDLDNWAVPYQKVIDIYEADETIVNANFDNRSFRHLARYSNTSEEKQTSYISLFPKKIKSVDFFTFELGLHDFVQYINSGGYGTFVDYMVNRESFGESLILDFLVNQKAKGIIANVPDALDFPIFKYYTLEKLKKSSGNDAIYISRWANSDVRVADANDIFLPNSATLSLIIGGVPSSQKFGLSVDKPLGDVDILDVDEQRFAHPQAYNNLLQIWATKYNLPIVDLFGLYKSIFKGGYLTTDGIKVDASYPNGNFFSADGIYPSAFGQAVIANEFIKSINAFYGSKIPYISTKSFLK
jgi:hypothetical protein